METNTELQTTPHHLLQIAVEKGVDVEQLSKLMDLQERWEKKEAKKAFLLALSTFQSQVPVLQKNKKVDFATRTGGKIKYNYADLGEISSTIKQALFTAGLSYRWEIDETNGQIKCTCYISHVDGHTEATTMTAEKDDSGQKNSIQQKGSTITYLQRYTLIGALGLSTANGDVDGQGTGHDEHPSGSENSTSNSNTTAEKPWLNEGTPEWKEIEKGLKELKISLEKVKEQYKVSRKSEDILKAVKPEPKAETITKPNTEAANATKPEIKELPPMSALSFGTALNRAKTDSTIYEKTKQFYKLTAYQDEQLSQAYSKNKAFA